MVEFKKGDVVWHSKKGYIGIVKTIVLQHRSSIYNISIQLIDKNMEEVSNHTKIRKDRLGQLLYG